MVGFLYSSGNPTSIGQKHGKAWSWEGTGWETQMEPVIMVKPGNVFCICGVLITVFQNAWERNTVICHIMSFLSTMDHIYDGGPIRL